MPLNHFLWQHWLKMLVMSWVNRWLVGGVCDSGQPDRHCSYSLSLCAGVILQRISIFPPSCMSSWSWLFRGMGEIDWCSGKRMRLDLLRYICTCAPHTFWLLHTCSHSFNIYPVKLQIIRTRNLSYTHEHFGIVIHWMQICSVAILEPQNCGVAEWLQWDYVHT